MRASSLLLATILASAAAACGGGDTVTSDFSGDDAGTDAADETGERPDGDSTDASDEPDEVDASGDDAPSDTGADAATPAPDPTKAGPNPVGTIDDSVKPASTGDTVGIHCAYPSNGPTPAPWPLIVFAHGFQIASSEYYGYLNRLASFGYVACTADFPTSLFAPDHVKWAKDVQATIDWALAEAGGPFGGKIDATKIGTSGHSLGGKLSILVAAADPRVKASITLDPVDAATGCNPVACPAAKEGLPLPIPTAFIGETTDANAAFMACAPAADNYQQFFAHAGAPSLQVTVNGANHVSFVDELGTCGLACSFCNPATASHDDVLDLARASVVAFYERWLRGDVRYDDWLGGPSAQARWGTKNLATWTNK